MQYCKRAADFIIKTPLSKLSSFLHLFLQNLLIFFTHLLYVGLYMRVFLYIYLNEVHHWGHDGYNYETFLSRI
jgi:hypothetical protein